MKRAFSVVLMMWCLTAAANPLVPKSRAFARADGTPRKVELLGQALRIFEFRDRTQWITHVVKAPHESSPMGVTRFAADGTSRLFLATDWLKKGTIPRGSVGQIYAVAELAGPAIAATVGWNAHGDTHNAVLLLEPDGAGGYTLRQSIDVAGAADLIAGPGGTLLVVTDDARRTGGGPLLTVFGRDGAVQGEFFAGDESLSADSAARNAIHARLQQVAGTRYALLDPARNAVHLFRVALPSDSAGLRLVQSETLPVGTDVATAQLPIVDFYVAPDESAFVARAGLLASGPGTVITRITKRGVFGTWSSPHPWRAALRHPKGLTGVVLRDGVMTEAVEFETE